MRLDVQLPGQGSLPPILYCTLSYPFTSGLRRSGFKPRSYPETGNR